MKTMPLFISSTDGNNTANNVVHFYNINVLLLFSNVVRVITMKN